MQDVIWRARWLPLTHTIYRFGIKPWVPLTSPWGVTSYAPTLGRRKVGSLLFIPMTHGLVDMEFTYGCPNTITKIKEIIADRKDVRCVKSGVPTSDTTPGYPSWQANRGKGFKAHVVTGLEPPIHMFDDPIDYKAEMDYRYEDAFRQLEEKEIMLIQQRKRGKEDLCHRLDKTMDEFTEQKEKTKVLEA
ncbi:hypothetical protein PIB30_070368 [Stylosanthes scabra]|uniref:Uncharacterized protein n=1 Tax=Stylosanthes scabra TaxID=79078 RepID=A0ABU6TN43_9FABA|nr:hypothetical protein [Stylosanthes scabra]